MALVYIAGGLVVILTHLNALPAAIRLVFESAFSGTAAAGGFAGSTIMLAMRYGIARGLFSNEAGLGSAPLVHAAASTDHPVRQGLYGIFEVFVDTVLICTTTGLVILVTGAWESGETGAALSGKAFALGLPGAWGHLVVTMGLVLFAFSTLIGWSYYGETGIVYLLGTRAALPYRLVWLVFIYLGSVGSLHLVWDIADTLNGLMAIPNLISVLISIPLLRRLQRELLLAALMAADRTRIRFARSAHGDIHIPEPDHAASSSRRNPALSRRLCRNTPIGELLDNPARYDGKTVRVEGEVKESAGGLGLGAYQVRDRTGTLTVVSQTGGPPRSGSKVGVKGRFEALITLGSKSLAVLREESRDSR